MISLLTNEWSLSGVDSVTEGNERQGLLHLTTEIVASFAGNNTLAIGDLPAVIATVFRTLRGVGQGEAEKPAEAPVPAVPVKKSIGTDYLVCLEDGKKVKMLKRYLASRYNLTPDQYRQRWGLAKDYPMVPPAYAAQRSAMAKRIGLGRKPAAAAEPAPEPTPAAPNRGVGRVGARGKPLEAEADGWSGDPLPSPASTCAPVPALWAAPYPGRALSG
jgi:predicted transcriptional regulator